MARKNIQFKSEELKETTGVAAFLRDLADKLESNEVTLRQGAKEVKLSVPATVLMAMEVQQKNKKGKTRRNLEIELEWTEGETAGGGAVQLA